MILCRWQGSCELQLTPSLHSSQSAGRQSWILNACAFPVYYWISEGKGSQEDWSVDCFVTCRLHIFLPSWPLFTQNFPETESPGQHKRQLTRSGIWIGVWLFPELLPAEHQHSTTSKMGEKWFKTSLRQVPNLGISFSESPSFLLISLVQDSLNHDFHDPLSFSV